MRHFLRGPQRRSLTPRPTPWCILFPGPKDRGSETIPSHGPKGRGRLEDYFPSGPGGPGRRKTIFRYVPLFGPALGLWFHSGLYGSILASVWPMVPFRLHSGPWFRFGLLVKSCAKQRRPRPEHTGGGICLAQILYKRGLLIRLQKRKIISEENLIVRWS